jgi:hypothetical protein
MGWGDRKLIFGGFWIAGTLEMVKKFEKTFSFPLLNKDGEESRSMSLLGVACRSPGNSLRQVHLLMEAVWEDL